MMNNLLIDNFNYLVGLDLVFTGVSGYSVFSVEKGNLQKFGLLSNQKKGTSDIAVKLVQGEKLFVSLDRLSKKYPKSLWLIEISDWVKRDSPHRDRETMKSLGLSRGLAYAVCLINQSNLPFSMGVKEVRGFIANPKASKKTQFYQIKQRFQLYDLKPTVENMNITDAIAIPLAYKKLAMSGNLHKSFRDVNSNVGQAVVSYKNFGKTLEELFGSRSVFRSVGNGNHIVPKVSLQDMGLKKGLVKGFKTSHNARYASYDLSATHPGVVVFEIDENGTPLILFHHTFTLKKFNNKAKIGTPSYEIEVASNLLISLLTLYLHFEIEHVIFEYSDWHRAGKALAIDRIAINSLFFSYGVIMAGAYQLGLQVSGINATEAKSVLTGKKTATKQDIEKIIMPKFPFLKNEHTRDAAAVAIAYITKMKQ